MGARLTCGCAPAAPRTLAFMLLWLLAPLLAAGLSWPGEPQAAEAAAPPAAQLMAPGHGEVRALVVGIDHYRSVNPLRGAVADARDIDGALHRMGDTDVTTLLDEAASRARVLQELDGLLKRSRAGDLVIISLAGHGAKEEERVKGSSRDGYDEVFLLVGFDPKSGPGGTEKLLNHEFHHYIKQIEAKGAQVLFVADTCYGGGLAREIAIGAPQLTYRQVRYRLAQDDLKPVSTRAEAFLSELDFDHTTFLAAVDSDTKAPEVMIDGAYRGALSYAIARAIEGAADEKHDGKITMRELFSYTRKVVYQLSNERQTIVTMESPNRDLDHDVVLQFADRGIPGLVPLAPPASPVTAAVPIAPPASPVTAAVPIAPPASPVTAAVPIAPPASPVTAAVPIAPPAAVRPVRLASLEDRPGMFTHLQPLLTPFEVVAVDDAPDVTWDPVAREAFEGGDRVALDVGLDDLPGVIDRTAAVRDIKALLVKSPVSLAVLPDASLYREGSHIAVEVRDASGSNLVLVDVTGSGTVQLLYPRSANAPALGPAGYKIAFAVRDPFGADEVLAVTSHTSLDALTAELRGLDNRRSAGKLLGVLKRFGPPDARFGLVGLFTMP